LVSILFNIAGRSIVFPLRCRESGTTVPLSEEIMPGPEKDQEVLFGHLGQAEKNNQIQEEGLKSPV
jgi:hypothetical protein